jgi:Ni/Co efflux regulator RcnB
MEEQAQVEKEEKSKIGRKPVKESYATYIEKALKLKTVKSLDEVVEKVNEWKPGKDLPALKRMAKVIINEVKKQKQPRWKGYKWDESEFLLTEEE